MLWANFVCHEQYQTEEYYNGKWWLLNGYTSARQPAALSALLLVISVGEACVGIWCLVSDPYSSKIDGFDIHVGVQTRACMNWFPEEQTMGFSSLLAFKRKIRRGRRVDVFAYMYMTCTWVCIVMQDYDDESKFLSSTLCHLDIY